MTNQIKLRAGAQATLAPLDATTDPAARAVIDEALHVAAAVDGDRIVDSFEADAICAAFDDVKPQGGALTVAEAISVRSALGARLAALQAARPQSTEVAFTSQGNAVTVFRKMILDVIDASLHKAQGKPVDVNMMLFAFTDKVLADEIVLRAQNNPNLTLRLLTDWNQLATSGDRQPPRLAMLAAKQNIPSLVVKFKADTPYAWDAAKARANYSHAATQGLNHHKGFVAVVDGRVEKMTLGSFNWSVAAMEDNLENLMVLDRKDVDNRAVMESYQKEFEAAWNDDRVALSLQEALELRENTFADLAAKNGQTYTKKVIPPIPLLDIPYHAVDATASFDLNSFHDEDAKRLQTLVGKRTADKIFQELRDFGRFDDLGELLERVSALGRLSQAQLDELSLRAEFSEGGLSVNTASVDELDRAGFSTRQAEKLVQYRDRYGALESLDEVAKASGIAEKRLAKIALNLSDDEAAARFSARVPGEPAGTTGFSPHNQGLIRIPKRPDAQAPDAAAPTNRAEFEDADKNITFIVADLLRRAPAGETFYMAMYGISPNSPEFAELRAAAQRGVKVRAVLYSADNQPASDALNDLKAQGLDVDVRVIKSRVMHEKFGVVGDDVFNGSANFSTSSSTKHAEDRFLFRNMPDLAKKFVEEFDRLWAMGR